MALDDITQKILADAQAEVEKIEQSTQEERARLERETDKKKETLRAEHEAALKRDEEHLRKQARSHAEQAKKQAVEMTKRQHIDSVFNDAYKKLLALPDTEYKSLITSLLRELPNETQGTLHAPSNRLAETREALSAADKAGFDIVEDGTLAGGFRISGKTADYDYSFERLIEDARDEHELSVASILFEKV